MSISLRYGRRVLINAKYSNIKETKKEDFLEIIDYDPSRKVLLVIGSGEPKVETPLHWFIHHAREDVNAVIMINDVKLNEKLSNIPITEKEYPIWSFEQVKETLKLLRENKNIVIRNQGVLFAGKGLKETEDLFFNVFEELK